MLVTKSMQMSVKHLFTQSTKQFQIPLQSNLTRIMKKQKVSVDFFLFLIYFNTHFLWANLIEILRRLVGFSSRSQSHYCDFCGRTVQTRTKYQNGSLVYLSSAICIASGCLFGCFLIPFCSNQLQDVIHYCPLCQNQMGVFNRLWTHLHFNINSLFKNEKLTTLFCYIQYHIYIWYISNKILLSAA